MQRDEKKFNLFAYGSLQCKDIMYSVAGDWDGRTTATLSNYRCQPVKGEHYPAIQQWSGHTVKGVLYIGIQYERLHGLDEFEGDIYERNTVTVSLDNNSARDAFAYVISRRYVGNLEPRDWLLEDFMDNGKEVFIARYVGFDKLRST